MGGNRRGSRRPLPGAPQSMKYRGFKWLTHSVTHLSVPDVHPWFCFYPGHGIEYYSPEEISLDNGFKSKVSRSNSQNGLKTTPNSQSNGPRELSG